MPFVQVYIWKGRDKATKKKLVENITSAISDTISCPKESVHVIITDTEKENWGIGGQLACDKFPDR